MKTPRPVNSDVMFLPLNRLRNLNACFLLATCAVIAACSASKDKAIAIAATSEFHTRFNNSQFVDLYDAAESAVRDVQTKRDFLASMEAMRAGQGAVVQSKEVGVDYNYSTDGTMVKLLCEVTYEKGVAREEFIWTIANGKGILHSYRFLGPPATR
jgi:hypothetical protein